MSSRPLRMRRALAMAIDASLVIVSYYLALTFRYAGNVPRGWWPGAPFFIFVGFAVAVHLYLNYAARAYSIMNRYIGLKQALRIVKATTASAVVLVIVVLALSEGEHLTPLLVIPAGWMLATVGMVGVRFYTRIFYERSLSNVTTDKNLLLVGAGRGANAIVREIDQGQVPGTKAVGIIDDAPELQGMRLYDLPILGMIEDLPRLIEEYDVSDVLIALDDPRPEEIGFVHRVCHGLDVDVKTVPRVADIVDGQASVSYARDLRIEDFLGRPPVDIDMGAIGAYLKGRRVLVTGAAGSIGSELCRQISAFSPATLVMVDKDESGLYHLHEQLAGLGVANCVIKPTSVALRKKMERLFACHRPEIVFHAAAFKHVPLMELSPDEAVVNNVRGTLVIGEAAARHGAERVVNISTDKAVEPSSVMGATKRLGEYVMQMLSARYPQTHFCSVRFGNVLGSRGSVIPLFKQQIESGGPVTVTHPNMERYFMTIQEAVKLVLQAAAMTDEIPANGSAAYGPFILEMGSPVKIVDVAHKMISLLNGNGSDTYVVFTGLRPGEKLTEHLFSTEEQPLPTSHPMIRLAGPGAAPSSNGHLPTGFQGNLQRLISLAEMDATSDEIVATLQLLVTNYQPMERSGLPDERLYCDLASQEDDSIDWLDHDESAKRLRPTDRPLGVETGGSRGKRYRGASAPVSLTAQYKAVDGT